MLHINGANRKPWNFFNFTELKRFHLIFYHVAPIHKLQLPTLSPHLFPPSPIQWYRGVRTLGRYIHGIPSTHLHLYLALPCFVNTATYPRLRLCSRSIVEKYKSYRQRCYISADGLSGLCQNSRPSKYHPPPPPLKLRFQPRISSASLNISTKN